MSITPIKRAKDIIRQESSARRDALSIKERASRSARICEFAEGLVSFRHADIVLLYAPIKSEIDVMPIAVSAPEKGKNNHRLVESFPPKVEEIYLSNSILFCFPLVMYTY